MTRTSKNKKTETVNTNAYADTVEDDPQNGDDGESVPASGDVDEDAEEYAWQLQFHLVNKKNGRPTGVFDEKIYRDIVDNVPLFMYAEQPYIYDHGVYEIDMGGKKLQRIIKEHILPTFRKSGTISRIYKLFFQDDTIAKDFEELNKFPPYVVNFRNGMYNVRKRTIVPHSPKYMCINQIPHDFDPDTDPGAGENVEKFLNFAVPDREDREMLLQYIGLCCTQDATQQKMLILNGLGGTGKSTLIKLIQDIVGYKNVSNIALKKLESDKFKPIRLMGKLMNACADLEIDALEDTSMIKQLIGEDTIDGEYKGKDSVSFLNYAKLIFSTNELPLVRNEKTNGFYRRLLILTISKPPEKPDPLLERKLRMEIPYMIHLAMDALWRMYHTKGMKIVNSTNSQAAIEQLNQDSDTVKAFMDEMCTVGDKTAKIDRKILYQKYEDFCKDTDRQCHTKNNFFKAMRNKGFTETRSSRGERFFVGIAIRGPEVDENGFMTVSDYQGSVGDIPFGA